MKKIPKIRILFQSCPIPDQKIKQNQSQGVACEQKGGDKIV